MGDDYRKAQSYPHIQYIYNVIIVCAIHSKKSLRLVA